MKARVPTALVAVGLALALSGTAAAHPGDGTSRVNDDVANSAKDDHFGQQHGGGDGHLPAKRENVDLVGAIDLFAGGEQAGRIGDVSAKGNYAYLTHYYEPE